MPRGRSRVRRRPTGRSRSIRTQRSRRARTTVSVTRDGGDTIRTLYRHGQSIVKMPPNVIVPDKLLLQLPYSEMIMRTTSTTAVDKYTFNMNSLYDPNKTGTGHQVMSLDQWANFYEQYIVKGFSYEIQVINMSDSVPARVITWVGDDDTAWGNFETVSEQPNSSDATLLGTLDGGHNVKVLKGYVDLAKISAQTNEQYSGDDLNNAYFSQSPSKSLFFQICHATLDGSSTTDVHYEVKLRYDSMLFNRKALSTS